MMSDLLKVCEALQKSKPWRGLVASQKAAGATVDLRLRVLLPPLASGGLDRSGRLPAAVQRKFVSWSTRRASPGVSWATGLALPSHLATPLWGVAQGQEGFWGVLGFGMLWGSYCLFVLCLPPDKGAWHTTWTDNSHKSDKLVKDFHTLAGEETPRPQGCAPGPPSNLQPLRHQHHHSTPSLPPSLLAPLPTGSLPSGASGKEPTYHCRLDVKDAGSISGWGRYPGEGNSNPLQYSCLENTMDKGAWQATVHRVP